MLFNSLTFVVFFAVVVTAYWSMRSWNARKNLLEIASYIFYGAWNPPVAAGAPWYHLSPTAPRRSSARRHFILHVSFSLLHPRCLSRSVAAHEVAARFRPGRFVFSTAGRRTNRACR